MLDTGSLSVNDRYWPVFQMTVFALSEGDKIESIFLKTVYHLIIITSIIKSCLFHNHKNKHMVPMNKSCLIEKWNDQMKVKNL